jgi:hypothetical protein
MKSRRLLPPAAMAAASVALIAGTRLSRRLSETRPAAVRGSMPARNRLSEA